MGINVCGSDDETSKQISSKCKSYRLLGTPLDNATQLRNLSPTPRALHAMNPRYPTLTTIPGLLKQNLTTLLLRSPGLDRQSTRYMSQRLPNAIEC